jgi:hypothetical protein
MGLWGACVGQWGLCYGRVCESETTTTNPSPSPPSRTAPLLSLFFIKSPPWGVLAPRDYDEME